MLPVDEAKTKIEELKKKSSLTAEENASLQEAEGIVEETTSKNRFEELAGKEEASLTNEEAEELVTLSERFGFPEPPPPEETEKKYAGKYDTIEELVNAFQSSEAERKRIETEHPEAVEAIENSYKDSQRRVTKLVSATKKPQDISKIPLNQRELYEMTQGEYDSWEKTDKLSAHAWLSEAVRKKSLKEETAAKVYKKYPQFYAMSQGIVPPDDLYQEFDRIASEIMEKEPILFKSPTIAEVCMERMEKNKDIVKSAVPGRKTIKPGFEQGKGGKPPVSGNKKLSEEEFAALPEEEQLKYMETSALG